VLEDSSKDGFGGACAEELRVLVHVWFVFNHLSWLVLSNIVIQVEFVEKLIELILCSVASGNSCSALVGFLSTISLLLLGLLSNDGIDLLLSSLELRLYFSFSCSWSLHPWVSHYVLH